MDPDQDTDLDPAFQVNRDPDMDLVRGFDDQKLREKNTADIFFIFF